MLKPTIQKLFDENTKLNSAQKAAKNELKKLQKTFSTIRSSQKEEEKIDPLDR